MCPINNENDFRSLERYMRVPTASLLSTIVAAIDIVVLAVCIPPEAPNYWIFTGACGRFDRFVEQHTSYQRSLYLLRTIVTVSTAPMTRGPQS